MTDHPSLEIDVIGELNSCYTQLAGAADATGEYVRRHCTLNNSTGLLLSMLASPYHDARDQMFVAFDTISELLREVTVQLDGYQQEVEEHEQHTLDEIHALLEELLTATTTPTQPAPANPNPGAPYSGGTGGFGSAGPSNSGAGSPPDLHNAAPIDGSLDEATTPQPPTEPEDAIDLEDAVDPEQPEADDTRTTTIDSGDGDDITIVVEEGATATIVMGDGNTTTVNGPDPLTESVALETDPDALAAAMAAENAQDAAFYDQWWTELAARDPLHRTADELREAWESRELLDLDASALNELGLADQLTIPEDADLSILPIDILLGAQPEARA